MTRLRPRGASLPMVLTIVTVMSFLAASMTALFMMNVNLTQGSFNGDIALTEAEAAINELLYKLGQDDTHTFGKNNEEIRGHMTPGFRDDEAFHVLTFRSGTGYPYSTNNVGGTAPTPGDGRSVPVDCIHVYSTGVCRGQVRTIEAVVRKPPAPFGLCASGAIHSISPLTVTGISQAQGTYTPGSEDKPGHVVSNSVDGISVDTPGSNITGFVRSCGPVTVAGPAQVAGGLRPNASNTALLDIDIQALNPKAPQPTASPNEGGMTGVVEIVETNHGAQKLDVMYYCGHNLKFEGPVQMDNAFLYVQGNLEIVGGLWGTGALIVDGDVTITGGTSLNAANGSEIALLSSGMITLRRGANNCFRGIIYSEKGLDAKNMLVIGSAVVNSPDPALGDCELEQMTFVADEASGVVNFTSQSYSDAVVQVSDSLRSPYEALAFIDPVNGAWSPDLATDGLQLSIDKIVWQMMGGNNGASVGTNHLPTDLQTNPMAFVGELSGMTQIPLAPGGTSSWQAQAQTLFTNMRAQAQSLQAQSNQLAAEEAVLNGMSALDPRRPGQQSRVNGLRAALETAKSSFVAAVQAYEASVRDMASQFLTWAQQRSNSNGSYRSRGERPPNVERKFTFDLNRYMPYSDRLQVTYWQVRQGRR